MMNIIADENMALVQEFFGDLGNLQCYAGRQLNTQLLQQANVLLVRSVTQVNQALLANTPVRFVGSATIGADHLDLRWLAQQQIMTTTAPACNARSVVEYVFAVLAYLQEQLQQDMSAKVLGVVGLGNVGHLLAQVAGQLGFRVIGCDPFVQRQGVTQQPLQQLLSEADIVCFHTPLTKQGEYPTYHLLAEHNLKYLKQGAILLNAGRGAVIDNVALLAFLQAYPHHLSAVVLDVWENEPAINVDLVASVDIATPHIAGYSLEGKWRGTEMIYQRLCQYLNQQIKHKLADFLPVNHQVLTWPHLSTIWQNYAALLRKVYPVEQDDQALRQTMCLDTHEARALAFDKLRKDYWPRRECSAYDLREVPIANQQQMANLGFKLC